MGKGWGIAALGCEVVRRKTLRTQALKWKTAVLVKVQVLLGQWGLWLIFSKLSLQEKLVKPFVEIPDLHTASVLCDLSAHTIYFWMSV